MDDQNKRIVVETKKNMGIAMILTFLFGPLGMLYSTVKGGIIMMVISVVVALLTVGVGLFVTWPVCLVWTYIAVNKYNENLM